MESKTIHIISFVLQSNMTHSVGIFVWGLFLNLCYGLPTGVCFLDNLKIFFIFESNHGKTTPYFKNSKSFESRDENQSQKCLCSCTCIVDWANSSRNFLINFAFLDLDGNAEFYPELRNNSMPDKIAELEHELELELENELEIELKLEVELAKLACKVFNNIDCIVKLIKALPLFW